MDNNVNSSSNSTISTIANNKLQNLNSIKQNSNSFWKNSGRPVPGGTVAVSSAKAMVSTFRDYQQSVSDAWDTGDDEFCIMSNIGAGAPNDSRISKKVSQSAALNVIETHRNVKSSNDKIILTTTTPIKETNINQTQEEIQRNDHLEKEIKPKPRNFHAYPGRPQLQRFSSNSQDTEYETKIEKFQILLDSPLLDLVALKKISWSGVPRKMRAVSWRLLSKYLPPSGERRDAVLESKRQGYQDLRQNYFKVDSQDETQQDTYRQIHIDVPRMNPQIALFQQKLVQEMFERILFIWAIRHPASGYVQGINDLVTPFFIVFLQETLTLDLEKFDISTLTEDSRNSIEADSFWCLSKFLDCIQDNYIFAQLGIQEKVNQLKDLIQRIDGNLHRHLQTHGVDYLQFSFRWMNNLLTRELPLHCTIRLWDTYLAESDGFAVFHLYVCAAFLLHWKEQLMQQNDFQGLMLLLQNLPTHNWSDRQINVLVAEAFRLKFTYADAPKHLEVKS
ncbi:TBC1 domain family member 22B isoform X2 [Teleopsis dalmanni]|uniref:TBC1 domain family member 22B isoform X2 n=1 Tax=Teleopsis dalmanni TaxID=139649 RepID=UPI0018CEA5EA|nr:TBC1 domain family member 22B isoform X2 [Teleopsis dalmanni]